MNKWIVRALALGCVLPAFMAANAATYTNYSVFGEQDQSIWSGGSAFVLDSGAQFAGVQWDVGKSIGGVDCFLGACAGAEIGAETSGKFGLDYGVDVNGGSFDVRSMVRETFTTPTSYAGTPQNIGAITLGSSPLSYNSGLLQVSGPTASGYVDLDAQFHAFAGAEVCVGGCYGPALGPIDFDQSQNLVSINRNGDGNVTVLGQTVSANQNVTALDGLVTASVSVPHLDSSSTGTANGVASDGTLTSIARDPVTTITANIAQIVAGAAGLPIPLSGKADGFGYNLVQAGAGVSLDLQQTLKFTPNATGAYLFSSNVTPIINGKSGASTNLITFKPGDTVSFLPGQVASISYLPMLTLGGTISNNVDLILQGDIQAKALGVDIAGETLGPLVDLEDKGNLGTLNLYNNGFNTTLGSVTWAPITLDFNCAGSNYGTNEFPVYGLCSSTQYAPDVTGMPAGNGLLVDSYSMFGCSPAQNASRQFCYYNEDYGDTSPYQRSSQFGNIYYDENATATLQATNPGKQDTDAGQAAALASQGGVNLGAFDIPQGDSLESFASGVPEPSSWATMVAGFGALGVVMRRRRAKDDVWAACAV